MASPARDRRARESISCELLIPRLKLGAGRGHAAAVGTCRADMATWKIVHGVEGCRRIALKSHPPSAALAARW